MGCDLKDAVGGRIANRLSRADVRLAEPRYYFRSGSMAVAEDARNPRTFTKLIDDFVGERGNCAREVAPVECDGRSGQFPVAGGRILAFGNLSCAAKTSRWLLHGKNGRQLAARQTARLRKAEADQVRKVQWTFARGAVGISPGASLRDMPYRVRARVAISGGIGS